MSTNNESSSGMGLIYILCLALIVIGIFIGELLHPVGFVGSLVSPAYLKVDGDRSIYTATLRNSGTYAAKIAYNITSDSELLQFTPSHDETDTVSPTDERQKTFSVNVVNGSDGSYTFVVHAYVVNGTNTSEVASEAHTITLGKK